MLRKFRATSATSIALIARSVESIEIIDRDKSQNHLMIQGLTKESKSESKLRAL